MHYAPQHRRNVGIASLRLKLRRRGAGVANEKKAAMGQWRPSRSHVRRHGSDACRQQRFKL